MKIEDIMEVRRELKRCNRAANDYLISLAGEINKRPGKTVSLPKQSGALKRASMDLTRALAKMRGAR